MPIADWLSYPPLCKIAKQWKWIWTKEVSWYMREGKKMLCKFYTKKYYRSTIKLVLGACESKGWTTKKALYLWNAWVRQPDFNLKPTKLRIKGAQCYKCYIMLYKCDNNTKWKKVRPAKLSVTSTRYAQRHVNRKRI